MVILELNLDIQNEEDWDFYIGHPSRLKALMNREMFYNNGDYLFFHGTAEFPPLKVKTLLLYERVCPRSLRRQRGNSAAIHRRRKRYFHDMLGWFTDRFEDNLDRRYWKIQCKRTNFSNKICLASILDPNPAIATQMYNRKSHPDDHVKFLLDYLSWNQRVTRFNVKVEAFTSLAAGNKYSVNLKSTRI